MEAQDRFLVRFAVPDQYADAPQTSVGLAARAAIGYYTPVVSQVSFDGASGRPEEVLARHPVPPMLLARLAVAMAWREIGAGAGSLKDALRRTAQAAEIGGIRPLAAHAKDRRALGFYAHFGLMPSPTESLHLFIPTKCYGST